MAVVRRNIPQAIKDEINHGDHPIQKALNYRKIKYTILDKLFEHNLPENIDTVNFFIDLHGLFSTLYTMQSIELFDTINKEEKYMISSQVLNCIAHFRHYFASRQGLYSNFYFYYSYDICDKNIEINSDFRKSFYDVHFDKRSVQFNQINKVIHQNINLCEIICKYIPHAYFINTGNVDFSIVPYHFIKDQKENEVSIIYTNDELMSLNLLENKKNLWLTMNGDDSKLIGYHDIYDHLIKGKNVDDFRIDEIMLPYVFALSGVKRYSIKGMPLWGYYRSTKYLYDAIKEGLVSEIDYKDPELFIKDFKQFGKIKHIEQLDKVIKNNMIILNPKKQYEMLSDIEITKIFDLIDLVDKESIMAINNQYYTKYPIHLEELMEGEEYT